MRRLSYLCLPTECSRISAALNRGRKGGIVVDPACSGEHFILVWTGLYDGVCAARLGGLECASAAYMREESDAKVV